MFLLLSHTYIKAFFMQARKHSEISPCPWWEKWFFLPCSKSCHLHHAGKKTQDSWKSNLTTVYFLMKIPALPLLSKTSPQNTCFLIIACTILTPLLFSLIQKVLISRSLNFSSTLSLVSCRGDSLILGFKHSPPRNISGGKKSIWLNRKIPTHLTFHCILSSYSLFWRSHTSYYSHLFSSFTHWAPDAFATSLTLSLLCCLPFHPLQVMRYSWTLLQPALLQHTFAPAAYFHFRKSLRHGSWHLQPKNIIAFSSDTTQGMSFGFRAVGSVASSCFWPSKAESAVQTHLLL